MEVFNINPSEKKNQEYFELLKKYMLRSDHPFEYGTPPGPIIGDAMYALWKDENVNKLMKHQAIFYLCDPAL